MGGDSAEQRRLKRWRLIYYLRVFDRDTGALLGHVADISMKGLKLVHDAPIELGRTYRLGMEFPVEKDEPGRASLEAVSVWTRADPNPDFANTGFELREPDETAVERIMTIVDELGFD